MALPLKSGADLYNQQALRLRLHNLGADPLEVGEGLIYYNTSTGLNTSGKARIYTGAGWKTLAFSEDLDVASNADFLALKEKVDLLAGDVDTDAIISNMKEVAAFLDGFAEDADLMTLLNSKAEAGIENGDGYVAIPYTESRRAFIYYKGGFNWYVTNEGWNGSQKILHAGNVGDYALPIIDGIPHVTLYGWPNIEYYNGSDLWGRIGFSGAGVAAVHDTTAWRTLIHSGNIGSYNAGSATKLKTARTIWGQSFDGTGDVSGDIHLNQSDIYWYSDKAHYCIESVAPTNASPYLKVAHHGGIEFHAGLRTRMFINSSGGVTIGGSDKIGTSNTSLWVDGHARFNADAYLTNWAYLRTYLTDGTEHSLMGVNNNDILYINDGTTVPTIIRGGNVLIGTANDDGASKLQVAGDFVQSADKYGSAHSIYHKIHGARATRYVAIKSNFNEYANFVGLDIEYEEGNLVSILRSGNVGIGTTSPSEKLSVAGNITATGEISCGGAGEEGVGGGGASVYQHVFTPSASPSVQVLHNLGTEDIVITLYEKDATSGLWSVCLTDIEIVSANEINITFGSTSNQEHKVVIMGGAA